jgi:TolB protein
VNSPGPSRSGVIYLKDIKTNFDYQLTREGSTCSRPITSLESQRVAYICEDEQGGRALHTQQFKSKVNIKISNDSESVVSYDWGPHQRWLYYSSQSKGTGELYQVTGTGSQLKKMTRGQFGQISNFHVASKANMLAVQGFQYGREQIWIGDMAFNTPMRITPEHKNGIKPRWSPDGKRLAYLGQDPQTSPHYNLEVFDLTRNKTVILTEGSKVQDFLWSGDGKKIYYSSGINVMDLNVFNLDSLNHHKLTLPLSSGFRNELNPTLLHRGGREGVMFEAVTDKASQIIWIDPVTKQEEIMVNLPGYNYLK